MLLQAMGPADRQRVATTCGANDLANTKYGWGDFEVIVLNAPDESNEYGFSYPPGSVVGWRIDPTLDGDPGLAFPVVGPEGTEIGTPLTTLEERFTVGEWDSAGVGTQSPPHVFSIFAGDTTGAGFELDDADTVVAMSAGYSCSN